MDKMGRRVGLCGSLMTVLAAGACSSEAAPTKPDGVPAAPPAVRQVVVLGDSLAVSPSRDRSFPSVLQARIQELHLPWTVVNAGQGGDTTGGGVRRVDALLGDEVGVLVLALGANDGLRGVDVAAVERNLATIIERAQARGIAVLLCGMETPPIRGWHYTLAFHRVFPRLAERFGVPLVPFLLAGVALDPEMNGSDGVHPNAAGARRIADTVWPHLRPMLTAAGATAARARPVTAAG